MDENTVYLDKYVKPIVQPMLNALLDQCPDSPKQFMQEWLGSRIKYKSKDYQAKLELETLRKEVLKYRVSNILEKDSNHKKQESEEENEDKEEQYKDNENIHKRKISAANSIKENLYPKKATDL